MYDVNKQLCARCPSYNTYLNSLHMSNYAHDVGSRESEDKVFSLVTSCAFLQFPFHYLSTYAPWRFPIIALDPLVA